MKTRFVAYDRLGARRGVLTHILQAEVVPSKNELPTLTLTYPRAQSTHKWMLNSPEVAFEYFNNNEWVEPKNARFKLVSQDFDYLEEVETRNYSFIGIGEGIRGIYVFDGNGLTVTEEGKVQFVASTPGKMMTHVWDHAVQRGWKGFSKSFTATTDSAGRPWSKSMNLSFDTSTSLDGMLSYFGRLGLVDFEWEGRTLHVYNADTAMARDLTTGNNPMRFNLSGGRASVDSAPESNDHENLASHVIVTGENGLRWVFPTNARVPEGRREVFLSYSGVDDEGTALILAQPTLAKYSNSLKNTTRQFQVGPSTKAFPYIDYRIGDWVLIEKDDGNWERVQIFQLALLVNQNGVQGYVSLGDKIDSLLEKLNEAVQRVQGGSVNEGTEPPAKSTVQPTAPKGLIVSSSVMADTFGQLQTLIALNFTHDGKAIDGRQVSINRYEVHYRPDGGSWGHLFMVEPPSQAGSYSWLPAKKPNGEPAIYQFKVYAISDKAQWSKGSNIVTHTVKQDTVAPGKPQPPKVKGEFGVFTATVSHLRHDGQALEADYTFTVIQMASAPAGPWEDATTIVPPQKDGYVPAGGYFIRWFRAIAVDIEGNRSEPSSSVSAETKPLVNADLIISEIDAGKTRIINAGEALLKSGQELSEKLAASDQAISDTNAALTGPGGLTERLAGAETKLNNVGALTFDAGTTLRQKLAASDKAITDTTTSLTNIKNVVIPQLDDDLGAAEDRLLIAEQDITKAEVDITAARTDLTKITTRVGTIESGMDTLNKTTIPNITKSIDGKTTINRQTTVAANPANYSLGDRWEQWDKLTTGGKLLKTWRHNGTAWIEEILSASYLPLVDIGAGTFGSLEGGRLTANSVSTQSLLVGSFSNLIENGSFDYFTSDGHPASWAGIPTGWSIDPTGGRNGTAALRAKGITERTFGPTTAIDVPIEHGDSYRVSGWVKTNATTAAARGEICLYYYRADGTFFGNQNFNIDDATAEWQQFSGIITPNNTEPAYFRVRVNATLTHVSQEYYFDDIAVVKASNGSLIVNGSIKGDHVDAQTVGAKVGQFVKADIGNLVVTGSSKLTDVVAKRVAADTASFQTVDAKNIFVTGTASLSEVVAKRFAADTGEFLSLGVDQLTVTGTANMKDAVADRMFTNLFSTRKLTANQIYVGEGGNLFPAEMNDEAWQKLHSISFAATGGKTGGTSMLIPGGGTQMGTYFGIADVSERERMPKLVAGQKYRVRANILSTGTIPKNGAAVYLRLYGPTKTTYVWVPGSAVTNAAAVAANAWGEVEGIFEVPEDSVNLYLGVGLYSQAIHSGNLRWSDLIVQEAITPELLVDGAVTARTIEASEAMSAKIGQFLKLDVVDLVATGDVSMSSAVINKLYSEVVQSRLIRANMMELGGGQNYAAVTPMGDMWDDETANVNVAKVEYNNSVQGQALRFRGSAGITSIYGKRFAVKPGDKLLVEGTFRNDGGAATVGQSTLGLQYITHTGDILWDIYTIATSTTGTQPMSAVSTVPDGAVFARPLASTRQPTGTADPSKYAYLIDPMIRHQIDNALVVDGAVTTKKLTVTEDMTVALLKAHKVEAVEINFNSLFGDSGFIGNLRTTVLTTNSITSTMIESDAITSKHTLTGPTIRTTSASNRGIKIDSSGLRAWDGNGDETFSINTSNGQVVATGRFMATTTSDNSYVAVHGSSSGVGGSTRPRVMWHTGNSSFDFQPSAFTITQKEGNFDVGSFYLSGAETTANSSGRAALWLGPHDRLMLATQFGSASGTGFYADGADVSIVGKLTNRLGSLLTVYTPTYGVYQAGAGGSLSWQQSFNFPAGSVIRAQATADTDIMACTTVYGVKVGGCKVTIWFPAGGRASSVTAQLLTVRT